MKLVKVTWIDAIGNDGWVDIEDLKKEVPHEHHSVGYVAHETDYFITIAMSYDEHEKNMGAWLCIPKAYCKEIITLEL